MSITLHTLLAGCTLLLAGAVNSAPLLEEFDSKNPQLGRYTGNGKWTVVKIWASDCGICNQEAHAYVAFHKAHKDRDAQMVGISLDGAEGRSDAEGFIERHELNYPSLLIDWQEGGKLYYQLTGAPLSGTPAFLIYAPDGELLAQQVGAVPVDLIERFMADYSAAN